MSTQKPLSSSTYAGGARKFYAVELDPRVNAIDVPDIEKGDLILFIDSSNPFSKPQLFFKLSDGVDTDVLHIITRDSYDKNTPPTSADDKNFGYSEGSNWYDGSNLYKCVDCSDSNAVWVKIN